MPRNTYKSFLNKIKTFVRYMATVGIHQEQGTKKVLKRYATYKTKKNTRGGTYKEKSGGSISGKSHTMTVAKLAYQNEFGATIPLRYRYKATYRVVGRSSVIGSPFTSGFNTSTEKLKYSTGKYQKKQGYLLTDKKGNFVAYFKPETSINIPSRSFIRKTAEYDGNLVTAVNNVLANTFKVGGYRANKAFTVIAKLVEYKMKNNLKNNQPRNHPLTIKAKGQNSPLVDEQDRLFKSIKYKIYKDTSTIGSKGYNALSKQTQKHIDKLLKSADQFVSQTDKAIRYIETKDRNRSF